MPSFDYQKKKKKNFWKKNIIKNCKALLFKMLKLRVLDLFFHWNKCFCYYTESKVPKKGMLGTGTEFQVPVPYRFKCEQYPTLHMILQKKNLICWFDAQETLLIVINIENSYAA